MEINSSGCGLFLVDEAACRSRPVFLFFLMIQLVATAPRVSKVVSYKGVTMRSLRCGMLSGIGARDEDAWAGAGVAVAKACAVGAAEGDTAC